MNIVVMPGSNEVEKEATAIFGSNRVKAGTWREPVAIGELNEDEVAFAQEYFGDMGKKVHLIS